MSFIYDGFDDYGYIYYPTYCLRERIKCKVHIHLHGDTLSSEIRGSVYLRNAGFLEWAASNRMIVVFPQASWNIPLNIRNAWITEGYILDQNALNKDGIMPKAFKAMIDRVI